MTDWHKCMPRAGSLSEDENLQICQAAHDVSFLTMKAIRKISKAEWSKIPIEIRERYVREMLGKEEITSTRAAEIMCMTAAEIIMWAKE